LILSVFESESGHKYENKYDISDIRPYPIRFHRYTGATAPPRDLKGRRFVCSLRGRLHLHLHLLAPGSASAGSFQYKIRIQKSHPHPASQEKEDFGIPHPDRI
jgi:hypothetical protein